MKNSPSRFDNLWLFYLGESAVPRLVGELRYLQLTRGVSLTYAKSWIESGFRLSEDLLLGAKDFLLPIEYRRFDINLRRLVWILQVQVFRCPVSSL